MVLFRDLEDKDIDSCVKLVKIGHDPNYTRSRFEWLHLNSPLAPSKMIVAEDNRKIVGMYCAIKKHVSINGKIYVGARDIDPVVHPDYRRKGIFTRMLEHSLIGESDIDFHFNFANKASLPGFIKAGWKTIGHIKECFFRTDYKKILSKDFVAWCLCKMKNLFPQSAQQGYKVLTNPDFQYFTTETSATISVVRSYKYLKWRYLENPTKSYLFLADSFENKCNQMIVGFYEQDNGTLYINDFLFRTPQKKPSILYLLDFIKSNNLHEVRTWYTCPSVMMEQMISNPLNNSKGINFLIKKNQCKEVSQDIFNIKNWLLTPGDLEVH